MKPTSSRAARRLAQKGGKSAPLSIGDLINRVAKTKVKGVDKALETRGKRILTSYLETAQSYALPVKDVVTEMASGQTAWRLGSAVRDEILKTPPDAVRKAACTQGCAFCCILSGGEGGVITAFEATQLHHAVAPLAGQPDGRGWHPEACPALDPYTRSCRAYDARPMICRSFLSMDASACERNAAGGEEQGAGLLGSHLDYLVVHALCRQALKGITQVHTYSMAATAASAVAGNDTESGLVSARHKPSALDTACKDGARAAQA
ncbi:YkgJ family cysteine cluster protein [Roseobacter sp. CCS2]|uniref:YkgJ family cysteine cluster protein n=1 Tax=Roseobacter sp. CCS2 TaxID=391593 RepID=UPI0000F401ED|nr:YkgJ family cysteine cluster protein [Roseobacter sp. CCS2]EBA13389.1 ATP phosphoribosyltransferase catalytic subunit [Roseobacter sp. CCS2]